MEIKLLIKLQVVQKPQNNLEANEEMLRGKYISLELRQKITFDLRLKED